MNRNIAPSRPKSEATRNHILDSALKLFRERGFEQTTMRQIATESGLALGAAYYYFESKDALVMAFYDRAQTDLTPRLLEGLSRHTSLENRLRVLLDRKFEYFRPHRSLLETLSSHVDPRHPLSPFSQATKSIRDRDIDFFARAVEGSKTQIPGDLRPFLPTVLWLYQMGLLLFWFFDDSPHQSRTARLVDKTLGLVVTLIKFSGLPFMGPVRKRVVELLELAYGEETPQN
jgi:AcrR family transcriptional regulator